MSLKNYRYFLFLSLLPVLFSSPAWAHLGAPFDRHMQFNPWKIDPFAISLLLMLQVLLVSQASSRRQRRRAAFDAHWRPLLAAEALAIGAGTLVAPDRDPERRWWLQLWTRLQTTMRGESHARLNRLICALDLDREAVELLGRMDMRGQLIALACFRELGDPGYWPLLSPLLQASNPIKSLAVADALVAIDPRNVSLGTCSSTVRITTMSFTTSG